MNQRDQQLQIAATLLAGLIAQGMEYETAHKFALEKSDLSIAVGHELTKAYEKPRRNVPLTGWAESQLDAVDAGVFSGDPYQADTGRARFKFYLDRWCRDAYGVDVPTLLAALDPLTPGMPPKDAPCHVGICSQKKCGNCSRIAAGRSALDAVKL